MLTTPHHRDDYYEFAGFLFYPHRGVQIVRLDAPAEFALSPQQVKLLMLLVLSPRQVVAYDNIRAEIWPDDKSDKNFRHDIMVLKSSLAANFGEVKDNLIGTVRKQGYCLNADVTYHPADAGRAAENSEFSGEAAEEARNESETREPVGESIAAPVRSSFQDHLGHVLSSSCLYGLLHVLALWIETAYQIDRFRSVLWLISPVVFLWCGGTACAGLFWGWHKTLNDGHGGLMYSLLAFTFSNLLLYFAAGWILPPEAVTTAGFQTLTAHAAYLKNIFWFQALTILYLLIPWQEIALHERRRRMGEGLGRKSASVKRWKSSILKLIVLGVLLILFLPISALMTNHLFESLEPRPQMNMFMQLVLWRLIISGIFGFECLMWYARTLRSYEAEERN